MKTETWILLLGVLYLYSQRNKIQLTKGYTCFAQDGNQFPWANINCPYADYVYQDVPYYIDATGHDIRVN